MKTPTLKRIGIGSGLTGITAAIVYAAPLLGELYAGSAVTIALAAVPTLTAYLIGLRDKVEGK